MTQTALITGASAGLGAEFARYHAERGGSVIITARREEVLLALKSELEGTFGVSVHVIALDLGAEGGAEALIKAVEATGETVDILINNAGFGQHGPHIKGDIAKDQAMIDLNIDALVSLSHHYGREMAERGGGYILNVGSTAGFLPGPNMAVYYATKAFVNSYSQALNEELRDQGVTVSLLAPGYVETEFADAADLRGTNLVSGKGASARDVARQSYDRMLGGKLLTINDVMLRFAVNWVIPFLPRRVVLKMTRRMQSK